MEIPVEGITDDQPTPYRYTSPLDQWRQLPAWKRQWFEKLSERECEMIFPTNEEALEEWMKDRTFVRSLRKGTGKVGQVGIVTTAGLFFTALASAVWLGIQSKLGGPHP